VTRWSQVDVMWPTDHVENVDHTYGTIVVCVFMKSNNTTIHSLIDHYMYGFYTKTNIRNMKETPYFGGLGSS
jgi:hypothetical protein